MSKNLTALDELLAKATTSSNSRPLWRDLFDRLDEIIKAKNAGLTYRAMAEESGVSATNFNVAIKKAMSERAKVSAATTSSSSSSRTLPSIPGSKNPNPKQFKEIEL